MAKSESKTTNGKEAAVKGISEEYSSEKASTAGGVNETSRKKVEYTIDEFCNNANALFHTKPECVRAALQEQGIEQCDKEKAQTIVSAFIKKEVK